MKLKNISQQQVNKNVSFKNIPTAITNGLRFLNDNEALGASFVDFSFMVTPRTIIDATRNINAGVETGTREASSTTNHLFIGLYGAFASWVIAKLTGFNKLFNIKGHKIFANNDTIDVLSSIYNSKSVQNSSDKAERFVDDVLKRLHGVHSEGKVSLSKIDAESRREIVKGFTEFFNNAENNDVYKLPKELKAKMRNLIVSSSGSDKAVTLKYGKIRITSSVNNMLDNITSLGRTFLKQDNVVTNEFIKVLKSLKTKSALLGIVIPAAIGFSVQPINAYLTKKRIGSDGFVGVKGRKKNKTLKFKVLKVVSAAAAFSLGMLSIAKKPSAILNKIQFNGLIPNLSQFKFIYSTTIAGRLLSVRDGDEYRENMIKDPLGFINWLIFGGFASKLVAKGFKNANLINYITPNKPEAMNKFQRAFHWITKSSIKTCDEILLKTLKDNGISTLSADGKALSFGELLQRATTEFGANSPKLKSLKSRLRAVNISQFAGYLYSALALGIGIPLLNIAITNSLNAKRMEKAEKLKSSPDYLSFILHNIYKDPSQIYFKKF